MYKLIFIERFWLKFYIKGKDCLFFPLSLVRLSALSYASINVSYINVYVCTYKWIYSPFWINVREAHTHLLISSMQLTGWNCAVDSLIIFIFFIFCQIISVVNLTVHEILLNCLRLYEQTIIEMVPNAWKGRKMLFKINVCDFCNKKAFLIQHTYVCVSVTVL